MRIVVAIFFVFLIVFFVAVFNGATSQHGRNTKIKETCEPTELVVIGNRGRATRVYDCSELTK